MLYVIIPCGLSQNKPHTILEGQLVMGVKLENQQQQHLSGSGIYSKLWA